MSLDIKQINDCADKACFPQSKMYVSDQLNMTGPGLVKGTIGIDIDSEYAKEMNLREITKEEALSIFRGNKE